jgi:mannosyl-3-phosphoglycerate phosphatase
MRLRAVFTDLDGTLLEEDGSIGIPARAALDALHSRGVPIAPVSSKTRAELGAAMEELHASHGAFENGAGVLSPSGVFIAPGAVPVARLSSALEEVARRGLGVRALGAMSDDELHRETGLEPARLAAARAREYDLPFLAPGVDAVELVRVVASVDPALRLVRGGLFWHLSGPHDKKDAVRRILEDVPEGGATVGLGDAANDDFLEVVDVAVVVPRSSGPDPDLVRRVPSARIAPRPCGAGWAAAIEELLSAESSS